MTNVRHSLLNRDSCAGHARDDRDASGVKRQVWANALAVSLETALEEKVPIASGQFGEYAGSLRSTRFELLNERHQAWVQSGRKDFRSLRMKRDSAGSKINVAERQARFANPAALVQGDLKGNRHPAFFERQVPFLFDQRGANLRNVGIRHLRLFGRPQFLDAH